MFQKFLFNRNKIPISIVIILVTSVLLILLYNSALEHNKRISSSTDLKTTSSELRDKAKSKAIKPDEPRFLSACINKLPAEHHKSVWTMLTDGAEYARSAVKLVRSIRLNSDEKFDANILELVSKPLRSELKAELAGAGWRFCQVERIPPRDEERTFKNFKDQFTKLIVWKMVEYENVLYLDSDTICVDNIDFMFNVHLRLGLDSHRPSRHQKLIAVSRDMRSGVWQKTFNMGVFAIRPSIDEFDRLMRLKNDASFKFETIMSEQGFLNKVGVYF